VRRFIWLATIVVTCSFPATAGNAATSQQWEEVFFEANQAYKQGRYQEAVDDYRRLIQAEYGNGHVYYNLANAHIRLNQLGEAILNYERARLMLPRDADLDFNRRYAHEQVQDLIARPPDFPGTTLFWLKSLSLHELFWSFAIINVLFWAILLARIFFLTELTYYLFLVLLVFWAMTGVSFGLKWYQVEHDDRSVILTEEVSVLAGPDSQDTVLFKLHEGTIVHHERSEDGWSLIRLPDKKRGWVEADAIEDIFPKAG
jgi:tetratricopeptide (TPR) repeat protein